MKMKLLFSQKNSCIIVFDWTQVINWGEVASQLFHSIIGSMPMHYSVKSAFIQQ